MSSISDTCGLFGKLPQQADFVSHFLPESFTEYWHSWLQSCISVSREQLGSDWLDYYLTSPVWRFAIMPNIINQHGIVGVMIPCVDEVGRYFPLTIAHLQDHQPWSAYLHGESWYQSLEKVALQALDENMSYTQFIGHFEALAKPEFPIHTEYQTMSAQHSFAPNLIVDKKPEQTPQTLALNLLAKAYSKIFSQYSLWWTEGSDHVDPCLLVNSNLPDAGQFAAMLDGNWQQWGWNKEAVLDKTACVE